MLERVLAYLSNWFKADEARGRFVVEGGSITVPDGFLQNGQRFRVLGSVFNDGLWEYPASGMSDEAFTGQVWALAVPADLLKLVSEIERWQADFEAYCDAVSNADAAYKSESFGGYTYTKDDVPSKAEQAAMWQKAYGPMLRRWRKL